MQSHRIQNVFIWLGFQKKKIPSGKYNKRTIESIKQDSPGP